MHNKRKPRKFLFFILLVPLFIFLAGSAVMFLWNFALAPVFHISTISFWQGLGIFALSKILFGRFGGRHHRRGGFMREKMMWNTLTPEQKEQLREEWKKHRWGHRACEPVQNA